MNNTSLHDILTMMGEMRKLDIHKDRLSRLIDDTLRLAEDEELFDEEMEYIAAAGKPQQQDDRDPFRNEKRR